MLWLNNVTLTVHTIKTRDAWMWGPLTIIHIFIWKLLWVTLLSDLFNNNFSAHDRASRFQATQLLVLGTIRSHYNSIMTTEIIENPLSVNTLSLSHVWFTIWGKLLYFASARSRQVYISLSWICEVVYIQIHFRCYMLSSSTSEIMLIIILKCRS